MKKSQVYVNVLLLSVLALSIGHPAIASISIIQDVSWSAEQFNPSIGQRVHLSFLLKEQGQITIEILDRDGFVVQRLAQNKTVSSGKQLFSWIGDDLHGKILPDEVYSLRIVYSGKALKEKYEPQVGNEHKPIIARYYDRKSGIVSYFLEKPSRVHMQAGSAIIDSNTKLPVGPVLKTIVNREPRAAGNVVEFWNGLDESGSIYVPDLPNFKMAIATSPLPENSVITFGNRSESFVQYALRTRSADSLNPRTFQTHHAHHAGLNVFEDRSPELRIQQNPTGNTAKTQLEISLIGQETPFFLTQPLVMEVFCNYQPYLNFKNSTNPTRIEIDHFKCPSTEPISINWSSEYGPVAVNSHRIKGGAR